MAAIDTTGEADVPARATPRWRVAAFVSVLVSTAILSQFFRTSNAVIAPELIRDLALTPGMLGLANGIFFAALMVVQVPLGILFDRFGVRVSVTLLALPMALGAVLHALAVDGMSLVAARFLLGIGCAGSFMGIVVLVPRWFPRERWSTVLGMIFGVSQLGIFLAGPPLAYAATTVGWRSAFGVLAVVAFAVGAAYYAFVRDAPPNALGGPATTQQPSPLGVFEGIKAIIRVPGMLRLFALFSVAYPTFVAVMGLWAGPYLKDIHGLDTVSRGYVYAAMSGALVVGNFLVGPLDRLIGNPRRLVAGGAVANVSVFAALAALPYPPLWLAVTLLVCLCGTAAYGAVLVTEMRSRYPEALAGRGATTSNMVQLFGSALLPVLTGFIPAWFGTIDGGYAAIAYRAIFAVLAVLLASGLLVYLSGRAQRS
jgi:MFS family permease